MILAIRAAIWPISKFELRAGHELRKTVSFNEQPTFKDKYTSIFSVQTGILCSLYLRHFLNAPNKSFKNNVLSKNWGSFFFTMKYIYIFRLADWEWNKVMVLAGELQFSRLKKRSLKKNRASDGIRTRAS